MLPLKTLRMNSPTLRRKLFRNLPSPRQGDTHMGYVTSLSRYVTFAAYMSILTTMLFALYKCRRHVQLGV